MTMASSGVSDGQAWESGQGQELTKVTQEFKGLQGRALRTASVLPRGRKDLGPKWWQLQGARG